MADAVPQSKVGNGLGIGIFIGLLMTFVLFIIGGALGYLYVKHQARAAKAGWNLVPVIVAADEIREDTLITYDMIAQRAVPEQFVTSSVVKPDSANYIVGQRILVPVQAGDPLLWSQFESSVTGTELCDSVDTLIKNLEAAKQTCEVVRTNAAAAKKPPRSLRPGGGQPAADHAAP